MDNINLLLSQGILPDELNFTGEKPFEGVNVARLQYNAFYRSYDYYMSRFPAGLENLPGFDKVIESIQEQNADNTPLKEITEKKSIGIIEKETEIDVSRNISTSLEFSISQ